MMPPGRPRPDRNSCFDIVFDFESPMFKLSTFYTVALSYDGEVLEIKNEQPTVYSDDDLKEIAQQIVKSGKNKGTWFC